MTGSAPEPTPVPGEISEESRGLPGSPPRGGPAPAGLGRPALLLTFAVGLAVGAVSWLVGEVAEGVFEPERVPAVIRSGVETELITPAASAAATVKNVALSSGLFGAMLGAALGLTGGRIRRSAARGLRAALVGLVSGTVAGTVAALALVTLYYRSYTDFIPKGLVQPLLMHAGIWGAIGAAGGLAFGLGWGGRVQGARGLIGGLVGASLGAAIYEIVGALAFPLGRTFEPTALEWLPRLLARLLVASLAAVGAALVVPGPSRSEKA
ncbi:hypothetical protein [Tautonia plasticadhaerens]|uniref:Uncharacterized protein n=1 Tax=Tautonia plasticadhaerens TaxID=2527974 RepID=A0A518HA95_9BACT|nr:hypothetical protein [Tautonia plasticadhaerens]QDV37759.1 hypothetical protein ElP_57050 [Tautonia plasticadhaerens]